MLLQFVLIALNAIFASAEIAVLSINEAKLERMAQEGSTKARRLFRLTREPAKFLATIQVASSVSKKSFRYAEPSFLHFKKFKKLF